VLAAVLVGVSVASIATVSSLASATRSRPTRQQPSAAPTGSGQPRPACAAVNRVRQAEMMRAYRRAGGYRARQVDTARGIPASVSVRIPAIAFTGAGHSSTLPVGPCQTIYRFVFPRVAAPHGVSASPFRYLEVDWNTEGLPRGPDNSFSSPHFDFHYYLRPRAWVDRNLRCVSTDGRTCNPQRTSFAQMRRFLTLPAADLVPPGYFPDTGSSIPMMGLHLLDGRFHYTVNSVNHHPTLIYGSFDGRLLFAESSVTLFTLQDAVDAPDHTVSFRFRQPRRVQDDLPWPTRFEIHYDPRTGGFIAAFTAFRAHPQGR
jgi:hypothetical protein